MRCSVVVFLVMLLPASLRGQTPASSYLEGFREIMSLRSREGRVSQVSHLVLKRDVAELVLERGVLYLLAPLADRPVAAVFRGQGRFTFTPGLSTEQAELARFAGGPAIADSIREVIFIFADSTPEALRGVAFETGEIPDEVGGRVRDLLSSLRVQDDETLDGDVLGPLLNGDTTGLFVARVERPAREPVLFRFNPAIGEAVQLLRNVDRRWWRANWAVVTQFPPQPPLLRAGQSWRYRERLAVPHYRMDIRLTTTAIGDMAFEASATLTMKADEAVGPWLLFSLHSKLTVDRALLADGTEVPLFKAKDSEDLWLRAPRRLLPGDSLTVTVVYRGDLIDRYGNWFYIEPTASWYPVNRQGETRATFDLTFHSPGWYPLASIGERTDSTVEGRVLTTRWVTRSPTAFASFNLGLFENHRVQDSGGAIVDVLISEDAHRELRQQALRAGVLIPEQRRMRENVAADVSNSLKLFSHLFGQSSQQRFIVTEIPYGHGVSFPGLIHLSWSTFQNTEQAGFDEFFRAHEVAHQWWGNDVRPASYRDAWLSEGLATFSGLWYLRTVRRRNDEYFRFLEQYRTDIRDLTGDVGPIWIGYRNATPQTQSGYQVMIYEKGAWVFHMLRVLMLDLQTGSDNRFLGALRDFYQSYRGRRASSDDFRVVVERHAGIPMDWFFDQWVKGTAIPSYRVAWTSEPAGEGKYTVRLRVKQDDVPPDFLMFVLVSVDLGQNRFANFRVRVTGPQTEWVSPLLPAQPRGLKFNELQSVLAGVNMERW